MLRAQGAKGTFYSYAETEGTVNINPLTDLSITKALKDDPATFFSSFGASVREIKTSEIKDAIQFIFSGVNVISGYKTSDLSNPFTAPFVIGNDQDKSLDALAESLAQSGTSYAELRKTVVDNADDRVSFDAKLLLALVTKKIAPVVTSMECTVSDPTTIIKCMVKGKNLTRPGGPITRIDSDLGIYVSRIPQQQPKPDSRLPFNPPYCVSFFRSGGIVSKPGPGVAGVFAEELEFTCSSASANTTDPLLVELVIRNNGRYNNSTNLGFILYEPGFTELVVPRAYNSIPVLQRIQGNYSGSFSGSDNGNFKFTINPDGSITGSGTSNSGDKCSISSTFNEIPPLPTVGYSKTAIFALVCFFDGFVPRPNNVYQIAIPAIFDATITPFVVTDTWFDGVRGGNGLFTFSKL